ncbi:hypothetical protein [Rhodoferax sp.]|uniref:hypothetical protein n=1 Tax=Rhodoferax sp. TaxID=50421 RepID=UPI001EC4E509|nr:hypothetical protein [Rhodoferax sp.]MBT9508247.1 hypothetical protein [Rhodoferax sp.]
MKRNAWISLATLFLDCSVQVAPAPKPAIKSSSEKLPEALNPARCDALNASTYQSLYVQTEGKSLLDQVELVIDDKGLRLGFDELNATFAVKALNNPANAALESRCVRRPTGYVRCKSNSRSNRQYGVGK